MLVEELTESNEPKSAQGISWGHYLDTAMPTGDLGTDSLASCFAFICIDKKNKRVFFAHVSTDAENQSLLDMNFDKSVMFCDPAEEITFLYVKGTDPTSQTNARIELLKNKYGGKIYSKGNDYDRQFTGVVLSAFSENTPKITLTYCKEINAINNTEYTAKTDEAKQWPSDHALESM